MASAASDPGGEEDEDGSIIMLSAPDDEFLIDADKRPLLEEHRKRIEENYDAKIVYGLTASDLNCQKQWVSVTGDPEQCRHAKEYVKALCTPSEILPLTFPPELTEQIARPAVHNKIERQSRTAIIFTGPGEVDIHGPDSLSVTLAMSALEDLVAKYESEAAELSPARPPQLSPKASQSSNRLDQEIRRLSAKNSTELELADDYTVCNNAVKRTILGWYVEDSPKVTKGQGIRPADASEIPESIKAEMNKQGTSTPNRTAVPSLKFDSSPKPTTSRTDPVDAARSISLIDMTDDDRDITSMNTREKELENFAQTKGYTQEEIHAVLVNFGVELTDSEFLQALATQRGSASGSPSSAQHSTPERKLSHPIENIINSPRINMTSPRANGKSDGSRDPKLFVGYLESLSRDFEDESGDSTLEECRRRNAERMRLLKEAFDAEKNRNVDSSRQKAIPDIIKIDDDPEDEVMATAISGPATSRGIDRTNNDTGICVTIGDNDRRTVHKPKSPQANALVRSSPPSKVLPNQRAKHNSSPGQQGNRNSSPGQRGNRNSSPGQSGNRNSSPSKRGNRNASPYGSKGRRGSNSNNTQQGRRDDTRNNVSNPEERGITFSYQRNRSESPAQRPAPNPAAFQHSPRPSTSHNAHSQQPQNKCKRHIVIDGSNIAMKHGNDKIFSCRGLEIAINYFLQRGHTNITAFVPQSRLWGLRSQKYPIQDQHLLDQLKEKRFLVFTPARRAAGKNIVCYDDKFVISLAEETDGVIVTNDQYKDIWDEKHEWRHIIETRLLMFSFVGDIFMIPEDPLGRNGPTLDSFLSKTDPEEVANAGIQHRNNQVRSRKGGYDWTVHRTTRSEPKGKNNMRRNQMGQNNWHEQRPQGRSSAQQQLLSYTKTTARLHEDLTNIFPDNLDMINRVLQNHPREENLNQLVSFILEAGYITSKVWY